MRTIAHCDLLPDLLQQLLESGSDTHLIVCATKPQFLVHLTAAIRLQQADSNAPTRHGLLTKTIGLIARSSKVKLTFCPSLESLRAYVAVLGATCKEDTKDKIGPHHRQLLSILDLVAMHATTSEFSAQGLSRTLASAVETSEKTGMDLRLYECTNSLDPASTTWGGKLWDTSVPLLNGSVRIRSEESDWGGQGITVKRVAERWFEFDQNH